MTALPITVTGNSTPAVRVEEVAEDNTFEAWKAGKSAATMKAYTKAVGHFTRFLNDWLTTTTHHDLHHADRRWNFGLYFTFWDRLMGTEHPDYHARFAAATTGQAPSIVERGFERIGCADGARDRRIT